MLDLRLIREHPDTVRAGLRKLFENPDVVDTVLALDEKWRGLQTQSETLKAERNAISKRIPQLRDAGERAALVAESKGIGDRLTALDAETGAAKDALDALMLEIPNLPLDEVPVGRDNHDNVVLRVEGEPHWYDGYVPRPHWEVATELGILDLERGVKLAGSRFYVLIGMGARLQRALIQWMLDVHEEQGYTELYPPYLVQREMLVGTGNLPKFTDNLYSLAEDPDKFLIPTAEVSLTNFYREEILPEERLPVKMQAFTACFRREQLSAGRDTRGIKRGHQFDKVEMVRLERPEDSRAALEELTRDAEEILKQLRLPYRVIDICTGDLSFVAAKKYDLEVWSPGVAEWLEVSSVGLFTDFQARRANLRFRREAGGRPEYLHTLNGSGLALPRLMIAIMETYQNADGTITIPEVLRPYLRGTERIEPAGARA